MTRKHLLEAAAMVFARDGFQGSSQDEIAATAGFTKGAVYSNFKSKDDLFLAVLDERFERGRAAIRGVLDTPDARSKLAAWTRHSLSQVEQLLTEEYDAADRPPGYPPADIAMISVALFDGLGVYRLIDPSFTSDQTLTAALQFLSDAIDLDAASQEAAR